MRVNLTPQRQSNLIQSDNERCLLLLLRIRSAHLEILGFPVGAFSSPEPRSFWPAPRNKGSGLSERKNAKSMREIWANAGHPKFQKMAAI